MLTDTEVTAEALACVLFEEPASFGKDECVRAMAKVSELVKAGKADDATADRVRGELGNHSAIRQWAIKQGFLPASTATEDVRAKAVKTAIAQYDAVRDAQLEAMTKPQAAK